VTAGGHRDEASGTSISTPLHLCHACYRRARCRCTRLPVHWHMRLWPTVQVSARTRTVTASVCLPSSSFLQATEPYFCRMLLFQVSAGGKIAPLPCQKHPAYSSAGRLRLRQECAGGSLHHQDYKLGHWRPGPFKSALHAGAFGETAS
jgi:hypothetical protein